MGAAHKSSHWLRRGLRERCEPDRARLCMSVFSPMPVTSAFSFFRPVCLVHDLGASLHNSLSATELVASATYVVPFLSPASVLDARLPVYVFCLFLQESMLGNHPNVRRENTFSMKILILNHI